MDIVATLQGYKIQDYKEGDFFTNKLIMIFAFNKETNEGKWLVHCPDAGETSYIGPALWHSMLSGLVEKNLEWT